MKLGDNVSQLSRDLGVHRTCFYRWKRQLGPRPQGESEPWKKIGGTAGSKRLRTRLPAWKEEHRPSKRNRRRTSSAWLYPKDCILGGIYMDVCADAMWWRNIYKLVTNG